MELRHLRYFVAVAETCHFGRAAEQLHVAQPALSYAIRQLEAELGVTLFNRTTRQVSLTAAGEFLRSEAHRILAGVEDAERGVRRIARGSGGVLRLGLTGTAAFSHLPRIARLVKRELPAVALEIQADMLTPAQCDGLRSGALDLGVLRPPAVGEGVEMATVDVESLVLAVSVDHRLAVEPVVSLTDLRSEPFIAYASRDSAVNDAVLRSCRAAGFVPRREHSAPGTAVLLALAAAGLGVAVVPESVRALPLDGVVFRDLVDGGTVELALAWLRDADNPLVDAVVDILKPAIGRELAGRHQEEP
ncbi:MULTISPECIES: LysR substrate-binding domain-containing protein [Mycobacteriaceae]|uniref:Probable hydrogen peroxide-inducible genes activator n=2 Tax=Mycobacteriaceae TaxID=1762 RepID=A0AAW5T608_9MYCO|nr:MULTISPECIES: LysR substrate-binding domain-containing protein [Mycobacteriaceae]MBX8692460.1 LysR family transcriptional regulator [Mycobacterium sp. 20091114027_K0903767]CDO27640.1 LysR family transcriptional regulator [Mycolicibacterium vulneris]MCV7389445.1 LysR family transcriptional regulator [Mycolicibacterium porcinum]ODR23561.1 LysR family transcriptional regulator [Mycolicibacterium porcinum]OHT93120.1 LysR family transcriptional regulator [Mycobacterium syngnathidarum]